MIKQWRGSSCCMGRSQRALRRRPRSQCQTWGPRHRTWGLHRSPAQPLVAGGGLFSLQGSTRVCNLGNRSSRPPLWPSLTVQSKWRPCPVRGLRFYRPPELRACIYGVGLGIKSCETGLLLQNLVPHWYPQVEICQNYCSD